MAISVARPARRSSVAIVVETLLPTLGLYGATLVIAFVAGMFPLLSIELFLFGVVVSGVEAGTLVALIGIAALGHQIAKTVTYYAGAGALELPRGKTRGRIEAAKRWIERWNRWPRLVMFAAAAVGLPPLYPLGFIASPLLKMPIATFTVLSLSGRIVRYAAVVAVARLV